jgi:hypothetical protein
MWIFSTGEPWRLLDIPADVASRAATGAVVQHPLTRLLHQRWGSRLRQFEEIGIVGTAAIANAGYHATAIRDRDLPITLAKLLSYSVE